MTSPRYQSAAPSSKMRDCFLTIIKSCLPHLRVRTFHLASDGQGRAEPHGGQADRGGCWVEQEPEESSIHYVNAS